MSANPLSWIAAIWSAVVERFGEWAYVGAAYGVFAIVLTGLVFWYVQGHHRAQAAFKRGGDPS